MIREVTGTLCQAWIVLSAHWAAIMHVLSDEFIEQHRKGTDAQQRYLKAASGAAA